MNKPEAPQEEFTNMHPSLENLKGLLTGQGMVQPVANYQIDPDQARVCVRFSGKLTVDVIDRYATALRNSTNFEPSWSEIVDLRAVVEIEISAEQAIVLADRIDPFSVSSRRAFVVANELQRHSARMQQILRSPFKTIGIFDTMTEAEAWVRSPVRQAPVPGGQLVLFPSRVRP